MRANKSTVSIAVYLGFLLIILDSKTALSGAREGLSLAANVLIPSIFPFLYLTIFLTSSVQGTDLPVLKPLGKFLHLPHGSDGILLSAFLGGYPAGAQAVSQAYHAGAFSKKNAELMLSFANNAGPSFLFGMASSCFSDTKKIWLLWLTHIFGSITAAKLYPCQPDKPAIHTQTARLSPSSVLNKSLAVMSVICGWVILFRVIIAFADRWFLWVFPPYIRTSIIGLLELSNGICELNAISDEKIRFLVCSGMLSLGGMCVTMQTYSVTDGLDKGYYFRGKLTQLFVSLSCSAGWIYHELFFLPLLLLPIISIRKNRSGNPSAVSV